MCLQQHRRAAPVSLKVVDFVMLRVLERHSKLSPKFVGPRQIIRQLGGHKFELYDVIFNSYEIVHSDRLKKTDAQPEVFHSTLVDPLLCLSLTMSCLSFRRTIITCVLPDKGFLLGSRKCCPSPSTSFCAPFWLQTLRTSSREPSLHIWDWFPWLRMSFRSITRWLLWWKYRAH